MRKILLFFCCLIYFPIQAQNVVSDNEQIKAKDLADELFSKQKYGAASRAYERFMKLNNEKSSEDYATACFYKACCDIELFRPDGVKQMERFVKNYPESRYVPYGYFKIAISEFRKEEFTKTLDYLNLVDVRLLNRKNSQEYYFKRGYCNLQLGNEDAAASDFYEIKDNNGQYKTASVFYYGYIAFKNKKYQTALESFKTIENEEDFADVIPFYLVQVYYSQQNYSKVISEGERIYDSLDERCKLALSRILANSLFRKEKYSRAIDYFDKYFAGEIESERDDNFEYGYCLYKDGKYEKAIKYLESVGGDDKKTQIAAFTVADCYLKSGNKKSARVALGTAASMNYDSDISESALFNYAKINYELSYSPFNETINSFDEYIAKYPDSGRNDEAYDYLVNVYMSTRNYKAALISMDKIKYKTSKIKQAYQKVAYNRGVELFNDYKFDEAIAYFNKSLQYKIFDKKISAYALFWKAEALYRLDRYQEAILLYNRFLETPGASLTLNYDEAYYSLAYSYFKNKDYKKAVESFKMFELNKKNESSVLIADARNRIADYYLYVRDYDLSLNYYNKVISQNVKYVDYALYKKSIVLGLKSDFGSQKEVIDKLLADYPETTYYSELCYEAGNLLMTLNKNQEAEKYYNKIIEKGVASEYMPKAMLQLGLLNFNNKNFTAAEEYYKQVIEEYKGTEFSESASMGLKNVMVENSRVDEYFSYLGKQGMDKNTGEAEKDSLKYISAERKYMDGDYASAINAFESYLNTNSNGLFVMNANYFLANSYLHEKNDNKALDAYEKVLDFPVNSYTLEAVKFSSKKNFNLNNYSKALTQYKLFARLASSDKEKKESLLGIVSSAYELKDYETVAQEGRMILNRKNITERDKIDILYMLANSYMNTSDENNAKKYYKMLSAFSASVKGAEAWYVYSKLLYAEGNYKEVEKEINGFMDSNSPHHYWLAKSFMLLSDVYLVNKDDFQAKYTLKSIIENYLNKDDGIIAEAQQRLDIIMNKEKIKEKRIKEKNSEKKPDIKMGDSKKYEELFEKDAKKKDKVVEDAKKILEEMVKESQK
jgi:tetratricopeptide (TPR) repeat protein